MSTRRRSRAFTAAEVADLIMQDSESDLSDVSSEESDSEDGGNVMKSKGELYL